MPKPLLVGNEWSWLDELSNSFANVVWQIVIVKRNSAVILEVIRKELNWRQLATNTKRVHICSCTKIQQKPQSVCYADWLVFRILPHMKLQSDSKAERRRKRWEMNEEKSRISLLHFPSHLGCLSSLSLPLSLFVRSLTQAYSVFLFDSSQSSCLYEISLYASTSSLVLPAFLRIV